MSIMIRNRLAGFANRVYATKHGLQAMGLFVPRRRNVLALLTPGGQGSPILIPACNIITDAGDIHYAQRGAGEAPTNAFGIQEMCSAGTPGKAADRSSFTAIAGSQKAHLAGYPQTADADADNTGAAADVTTWTVSYAKADFNAASITHGIITNTTPGAAEPLLTGYAFAAAFAKTADDTLKVIVNHNQNGV